MTKKIFPSLFFLGVFLPAVMIYYFIDTNEKEKIIEDLRKEYPSIIIDESISAKITSIYHGDLSAFRNSPHHAYVVLSKIGNRRIVVGYEFESEKTLDEIVVAGSLIRKEPNADTISILNVVEGDTLRYKFELRGDLGYKLKE